MCEIKLLGKVWNQSLIIHCDVWFLSNEVSGSWWPHYMAVVRWHTILKTVCNQKSTCVLFAFKSSLLCTRKSDDKIKVPFLSAMNVLSDCLIISVSTKCGEWVVYSERVTFFDISGWALVAPSWLPTGHVAVNWSALAHCRNMVVASKSGPV